jgi:cell division protein FtsQ
VSTDSLERTLERTRRRFVRRQRTRVWLRWRLIVVMVLIAALAGTAIWLVFFSTVFAVTSVEVQGGSLLSPSRIRSVAAVPRDQPLARVDLPRIRGRLLALAAIRDVEVTREWPDRVLITLTERTAVAVVPVGAGFKGIDSAGVMFGDFADRPRRLPLIVPAQSTGTEVTREAIGEGAAVVSALPGDLQRRVDHVEVETIDRISLVLDDDRMVLWGSAQQSKDKARVLAVLLKATPDVTRYDVSAPGQPVTGN